MLKSLKSDVFCDLVDICNMSFTPGVFSSVLKIGKVVPVHKVIC